MKYYTYIISNPYRTVLYTGVTNDIERRVEEHKSRLIKGFSSKYNCVDLLYYAEFDKIDDAILFEKRLKGWSRAKKDSLIKDNNPELFDLSIHFG